MAKEKTLKLAPGFTIPANDYANQANAVLGIREAGKTYTAMKAAEELLECDIPIIVFDPVGVWKNLKIGTETHKGYPVVVAGGEGSDIKLTKENAVDIVRAAMKENVSLVIDLYSPELINKSTWIAIVQSVVDLLMYENKSYGLRHIFIEEAAEFIPQKLQPQHAKVYSSLERLARMGRNAHLGMTIINQRAEEVNKAILEICELSIIHKQVGKNSMLSIQKWFEVRQIANVKEIIASLPVLNKGECWAVGLGDKPERIQVSKKKTFHPNPKLAATENYKLISKLAKDVTGFVAKINEQLHKEEPPKPIQKKAVVDQSLVQENLRLKSDLVKMEEQAMFWRGEFNKMQQGLLNIKNNVEQYLASRSEKPEQKQNAVYGTVRVKEISPKPVERTVTVKVSTSKTASPGLLGKCAREIIRFLAQYPGRSFSKAQVAVATGYSAGSGGFNNALSELNQKNMILRNGKLQVNIYEIDAIREVIGNITPQSYDISTYKNNLGKCEREIYEVLLNNPNREFSKDQLSQHTETPYSASSGGFNNALSRLNSLELIERSAGMIRLNPELVEML